MTQTLSSEIVEAQILERRNLHELEDDIERQMQEDQKRIHPLEQIQSRIQISPGLIESLENQGYRVSVKRFDPDPARITVSWGNSPVTPVWAALSAQEVELVQTTLTLLKISPECQVRLTPGQFAALLERYPTYNTMRNMESLSTEIDRLMPRHHYPRPVRDVPNPNHGTTAHKYIIGNAGSLSVVVRLRAGSGIAAYDPSDLLEKLSQVARSHGANEYGPRECPDYFALEFRMWWD